MAEHDRARPARERNRTGMRPLRPEDPDALAGFRIVARLGSGGMGTVYLSHMPDGRPTALKIVRAELAESPDFHRQFEREVRAASRVGGRYVVPVLDHDTDGPVPWLATAYVQGPSLGEAVAFHGPVPQQAVVRLTAAVADALRSVHGAGVVHRDLKPSNVLLAADGPQVIDFGIARASDATTMFSGSPRRIGTPGFMAPEQVMGGEITAQADVFALGLLTAFAAAGRGAFGAGDTDALLYRIVHDRPDLSACPDGLRDVVEACLEKDPANRPVPAQVIEACRVLSGEDDPLPRAGWLPPELAEEAALRRAPAPCGPDGSGSAPGRGRHGSGAGPVVIGPGQQPQEAGDEPATPRTVPAGGGSGTVPEVAGGSGSAPEAAAAGASGAGAAPTADSAGAGCDHAVAGGGLTPPVGGAAEAAGAGAAGAGAAVTPRQQAEGATGAEASDGDGSAAAGGMSPEQSAAAAPPDAGRAGVTGTPGTSGAAGVSGRRSEAEADRPATAAGPPVVGPAAAAPFGVPTGFVPVPPAALGTTPTPPHPGDVPGRSAPATVPPGDGPASGFPSGTGSVAALPGLTAAGERRGGGRRRTRVAGVTAAAVAAVLALVGGGYALAGLGGDNASESRHTVDPAPKDPPPAPVDEPVEDGEPGPEADESLSPPSPEPDGEEEESGDGEPEDGASDAGDGTEEDSDDQAPDGSGGSGGDAPVPPPGGGDAAPPAPEAPAPTSPAPPRNDPPPPPAPGQPGRDNCSHSSDRARVWAEGMAGQSVRQIQCLLNHNYGNSLDEDGIFGPRTDTAVRAVQRCSGIDVDGHVGPDTWRYLDSPRRSCAA